MLELRRRSAAVVVFALAYLGASAFADKSDVKKSEAANLPSLEGGLINSGNSSTFKSIIPQELYPFVRSGSVELSVENKLSYQTSRDEQWNLASTHNQVAISLNTKGEIVLPSKIEQGFLFGTGAELSKVEDQKTRALMSLWNSQVALGVMGVLDIDFALLSHREGQEMNELRGNVIRVVPRSLNSADETAQFFRERLTFSAPEPLAGYSWLTYRFFGTDEDAVWVFSSAIKKVRQLAGPNRADSMVASAFSLDDVFGWSGKPELLSVEDVSVSRMLAPFPGLEMAKADLNEVGCLEIPQYQSTSEERAIGARFASIASRSSASGSWLPFLAVFVPRDLMRIELESRDPFSRYGRQVIYLDTESMLPVYKFVYGRNGQHIKSIITAFGFAQTVDKKRIVAFPTMSIAHDRQRQESAIFDVQRTLYCDTLPKYLNLADFEPSRLDPAGKKEKSEATPTPSKKKS